MIGVSNWQMYSEIKRKKELKFSQRRTAYYLGISRDTVKKYWDMDPEAFNNYLTEGKRRNKKLSQYDGIITDWLRKYPNMSAAQVEDWLKEHYNMIEINERTVRRHVHWLRKEYDIPKVSNPRNYQALQLLPPGKQVQVDFGELSIKRVNGSKVKLYFAAFILSHSRLLYAYFLDRPFRTPDLILAFHRYFNYIGGMPEEVAIDQDTLMISSENSGDIIYTYEFERFIQKCNLKMHVCRKADPESKGIVESGAVRYIKHSFMPNRLFDELQNYQAQFEAWLDRTGNKREHRTIKRVPIEVFLTTEKYHLRSAPETETMSHDPILTRNVHKDNTIWFQSNRYTVPLGTYNKMKEVGIRVNDEKGVLTIYDPDTGEFIAEHTIALEKGALIQNRNHLRDYSQKANQLFEGMVKKLGEPYRPYLLAIKEAKPRYIRDQYQVISNLIEKYGIEFIQEAINHCTKSSLHNVSDLKDVAIALNIRREDAREDKGDKKNLLQPKTIKDKVMTVETVKRDINLYCELVSE